jgi:pimeloyl-CoA synthetase
MFLKLKKLIEKLESAKGSFIITELSKDENLKDNIIYYNTYEQLYNKGIDSTGALITPLYSKKTFSIKTEKGQRTDHVTLKDTGEFYDSFRVLNTPDGLLITADSIKDDTDLRERYGKEIIGLTDNSLAKVIKEARLKTVLILKKLLK